MDSNAGSGFKILLEMLKLKNPAFYLFLVVSLCLYWLLFYKIEEPVIIGFLGRSMHTKVFVFFLATTFINIFIFDNNILRSNRCLFLKAMITVCFSLLWIVFIIPAWSYSRYDNTKIVSYIRVFPIGYTFSVHSRTILYDDIAKLQLLAGGGDSATALRFYMKQGGKTSLAIQGISDSELKYFYRTLYKECDWLRDDISKSFSNFLVEKEDSVRGKFFRYGLGDIVFPLMILFTVLQCFVIIKYVFSIFFHLL